MIHDPGFTPVTEPVPSIRAIEASLVDQEPPTVLLTNVVVAPAQIRVVPDIAAGKALTVTVTVAETDVPII